MEIIKYLFYRVAQFEKNFCLWGKNSYLNTNDAASILLSCLCINIVSTSMLVLHWLFEYTFEQMLEIFLKYIMIPLGVVIFFTPLGNLDELYEKLDLKYKNDKHKDMKGFLVACYFVSSFLLVMIAIVFTS